MPSSWGTLSARCDWSFAGEYVHGIWWMNRCASVSTTGQSDERQVSELTAFVERGDYDVVGIFALSAAALDLLYEQP